METAGGKLNGKAAAYVLFSGILWGVINVFVINLDRYGFDSMQISLIRMFIAAVLFGLYLFIFDRDKLKIDIKDIWMFALTGIVSVVIFNVMFFYVAVKGESSIAVTLLNTAPIFVMVISAIFFKEKITAKKIVALVVTILGCFMVTGFLGGSYKAPFMIVLIGILSGFFYSLYSIFSKIAFKKYEIETVCFWTFVLAFIGSIPLGKPADLIEKVVANPVSIWYCLGIGIICTALPYFFFTWGLRRLDPSVAQVLACVEPLIGAVIGMVFYGDSTSFIKILGIALILFALVLLNINFKKKSA